MEMREVYGRVEQSRDLETEVGIENFKRQDQSRDCKDDTLKKNCLELVHDRYCLRICKPEMLNLNVQP